VTAVALLEQWHDFYLLAGTASVTLVGLLFVALSLHLDVLLHDHRAHLLVYARQTLLSFTYVLLISLMFLIPQEGVRVLGATITALSVVVMAITIRMALEGMKSVGTQHDLKSVLRRRTRILLIGYLISGTCGVLMLLSLDPYMVYWMVGAVSMLLGNAAGSSWDLLVQVGRLKRSEGADRAA
jgi:4-amino-4-deoxy-L-arabinose transferase-like glycosyltransferase